MQRLEQAVERAEGTTGQGSQLGAGGNNSSTSVRNLEEKRQRIAANQALAEYYRAKVTNNGSGDAQGLLEKLKDIFESTGEKAVRPPSQLKVTHGKSQPRLTNIDHLKKPAQLTVEGKELR